MAFTYNSNTLATSTAAETRFLVGDTNADAAHFDDAEIAYALTEAADSPQDAAISLLEVLATRYRQKASVSAGGQSVQLGTLADGFAAQADRLRSQSATTGAAATQDTTRVDGYSDDLSALDVDATSYTHSDYDHPFNENRLADS